MFLVILLHLMPLIAAGVAVTAVIAIPVLRRKLPRAERLPRSSRPDSATRIVVGVSAAALILLTAARMIVPALPGELQNLYYLGSIPGDYRWWDYAEVLMLACLMMLIVTILLACHRRRPEEPVAPTHPRTWRSFTTSAQLWLLSISVLALFLVVIFAGSSSSPDSDGHYRLLEIETGSTSGGMVGYFGWAYGLPAAVVTGLLTALTVTTLHLNAARPFLNSATVRGEEASRSALSVLFVWFAVGAILATLGRALRTLSIAAGTSFHTEGYSWDTTIAELSPWLYWAALFIQFGACAVLGLVTVVAFLRPASRVTSTRSTLGVADATQSNAHRPSTRG